jgi:hypothetical protein
MPALDNPRWERFAQAIVEGLANGDRKPYSQGRAYIAAGYTAKDQGKRGGSAECAASRLLNRVKPILERVRELQAEFLARNQSKIDLSRERVGRRLDLASRIAEEQKNPSAIASSELGIAKVFGHISDQPEAKHDFNSAQSMQDIARKLLQSVGLEHATEDQIEAAILANDKFIAELERIAQQGV